MLSDPVNPVKFDTVNGDMTITQNKIFNIGIGQSNMCYLFLKRKRLSRVSSKFSEDSFPHSLSEIAPFIMVITP